MSLRAKLVRQKPSPIYQDVKRESVAARGLEGLRVRRAQRREVRELHAHQSGPRRLRAARDVRLHGTDLLGVLRWKQPIA